MKKIFLGLLFFFSFIASTFAITNPWQGQTNNFLSTGYFSLRQFSPYSYWYSATPLSSFTKNSGGPLYMYFEGDYLTGIVLMPSSTDSWGSIYLNNITSTDIIKFVEVPTGIDIYKNDIFLQTANLSTFGLRLECNVGCNFSLSTTVSIKISSSPPPKSLVCETIDIGRPVYSNAKLYKMQGQSSDYNKQWLGQNKYSFNKISGGGGFNQLYFDGIDDPDDVKFFDNTNTQVFGTNTFNSFFNDGYIETPNYFTRRGPTSPGIVVYNQKGFSQINTISNGSDFDYNVYFYNTQTSLFEYVPAYGLNSDNKYERKIGYCTTGIVCSLINELDPKKFYTIKIVPLSGFSDYEFKDIELYDYDVSKGTAEMCQFDDGTIELDGTPVSSDDFDDFQKNNDLDTIINDTFNVCESYSTTEKLANPICWTQGIVDFMKNTPLLQKLYDFINSIYSLIDLKPEPSGNINIKFFDINGNYYNNNVVLNDISQSLKDNVPNFIKNGQEDTIYTKIFNVFVAVFGTIVYFLVCLSFITFVFLPVIFIYSIFRKIIQSSTLNTFFVDDNQEVNNVLSFITKFTIFGFLLLIFTIIIAPILTELVTYYQSIKNLSSHIISILVSLFTDYTTSEFIKIYINSIALLLKSSFFALLIMLILARFGKA